MPPTHSGQQRFAEEGVCHAGLTARLRSEGERQRRAGCREEKPGSGLGLKGGNALIPAASRGRSGPSEDKHFLFAQVRDWEGLQDKNKCHPK